MTFQLVHRGQRKIKYYLTKQMSIIRLHLENNSKILTISRTIINVWFAQTSSIAINNKLNKGKKKQTIRYNQTKMKFNKLKKSIISKLRTMIKKMHQIIRIAIKFKKKEGKFRNRIMILKLQTKTKNNKPPLNSQKKTIYQQYKMFRRNQK